MEFYELNALKEIDAKGHFKSAFKAVANMGVAVISLPTTYGLFRFGVALFVKESSVVSAVLITIAATLAQECRMAVLAIGHLAMALISMLKAVYNLMPSWDFSKISAVCARTQSTKLDFNASGPDANTPLMSGVDDRDDVDDRENTLSTADGQGNYAPPAYE